MLPIEFEDRMRRILKSEYGEFRAALEEDSVRAVRVNTSKISVEDFLAATELSLTPLSYAEDGFIIEDSKEIGRSAEHHAGMFYVQDPGALATVNALDIGEGALVLDACSAPGGKASQLASKIGEDGFLFANEYVPKRAKIIVGNLERLGIKNAYVTSLDTSEFPKMFSSVFDLVLCDAPCSGEGMFRKYSEAIAEWSEENVGISAKRQREILDNCAPTVKPGGYLLYSTCTYSPEENEENIAAFLDSHGDFSLVSVKKELREVTADGLRELSDRFDLSLTRRFYPHVSRGEGQFIALLKKDDRIDTKSTFLYKSGEKAPTKEEISVVTKFFKDNLKNIPSGRLIKQGDGISLVPSSLPVPQRSLFMAGVMVGEVRKGILFPHHQFFSAYGKDFIRQENLKRGDKRVNLYLRGEEIDACECRDSGYACVLYEGVTLGGGKISSGRIKNHYPKGLRNK